MQGLIIRFSFLSILLFFAPSVGQEIQVAAPSQVKVPTIAPKEVKSVSGTLPTGEKVLGGGIAIHRQDAKMIVQQAQMRGAIEWKDFSVGKKNTVEFKQPSAEAITLNRVVGSKLSEIYGQIKANGKVILTNPNGFVFHEGSLVDVHSFVVSTKDVMNPHDFLNGAPLLFKNTQLKDGKIILQAGASFTLKEAGLGCFISPFFQNYGMVLGQKSDVMILGAKAVSLDFYGDHLTGFHLSEGEEKVQIENSGVIDVGAGRVLVQAKTAEKLIESSINMAGDVRASSLQEKGGKITLDADGGTVTVSGKLGGASTSVHALGKEITVEKNATIDVSGPQGGGIYLGAHPKNNPDQKQISDVLTVQDGAVLKAEGIQKDGGEIRLYADKNLTVAGDLSVASQQGNGGTIELSTHTGKMDFSRMKMNLSAPQGEAGLFHLDPNFIAIYAEGADHVFTEADVTLTVDQLVGWLNAGNVLLEANTGIGLNGAITGWTNSSALYLKTVNAGSQFYIDGVVNIPLGGRVFLYGNPNNGQYPFASVGEFVNNSVGEHLPAVVILSLPNNYMPPDGYGNIWSNGGENMIFTNIQKHVVERTDTLVTSNGALQTSDPSLFFGIHLTQNQTILSSLGNLNADQTIIGSTFATSGAGVGTTDPGDSSPLPSGVYTLSFTTASATTDDSTTNLNRVITYQETDNGLFQTVSGSGDENFFGDLNIVQSAPVIAAGNFGVFANSLNGAVLANMYVTAQNVNLSATGAVGGIAGAAASVSGLGLLYVKDLNATGTITSGGGIFGSISNTAIDQMQVENVSIASSSQGAESGTVLGSLDSASIIGDITVDSVTETSKIIGNGFPVASDRIDNLTITGDAVLSQDINTTGNITVEGTFDPRNQALTAGGTVTLNSFYAATGSSVQITGEAGVAFNGGIFTLGANSTLTVSANNGTISFSAPLNSEGSTVSITADTVQLTGTTGLAAFNVTATTAINVPANITVSAGLSLNGPIVLGGDVTVSSVNVGDALDMVLGSSVDGGHDLIVNLPGENVTLGAVGQTTPLTSLQVGTANKNINLITLGGSVQTTGNQNYYGPVQLAEDITIAGDGVVFNGAIDSVQGETKSLSLGTGVHTAAFVDVGKTTPLASFSVTDPGSAVALFEGVNTVGDQNYAGALFIMGASTIVAGGDITIGNSVDGMKIWTWAVPSLAITASQTTISGVIGGGQFYQGQATVPLETLSITGATFLGANVTTSGAQTYNGPVTLTGDNVEIDTSSGDLTFTDTVDGDVAGTRGLTSFAAGTTFFQGNIGSTHPLNSLSDESGPVVLEGDSPITIAVGGILSFSYNISLVNDVTLSSGAIQLSGVTGQGHNLTLDGPTKLYMAAPITGVGTLKANSTMELQNSVTTTDDQIYNGLVTLENSQITLTGANITLANVTGRNEVHQDQLTSLTIQGQQTTLNGDMSGNMGDVSIGKTVLGADVTLTTTGSISLGAVTGNGRNLTANSSATVNFAGALGGTDVSTLENALTSVSISASAINFSGNVITTGAQSYTANALSAPNTVVFRSGNPPYESNPIPTLPSHRFNIYGINWPRHSDEARTSLDVGFFNNINVTPKVDKPDDPKIDPKVETYMQQEMSDKMTLPSDHFDPKAQEDKPKMSCVDQGGVQVCSVTI